MLTLVKIGGNVLDHPQLLAQFVRDFTALPGPKMLVHGGGVMASRMQAQMGMTPTMVEGRRITDDDTLRIVTMVYAGWGNKHLTTLLQAAGCNAIGLSGCDGNAICAQRRAPLHIGEREVDFGWVGDVVPESVNTSFLQSLIDQGLTPILSAINHDGAGQLLNTNADTMASAIAMALAQRVPTRLVFCFERPGLLLDRNDDSTIVQTVNTEKYIALRNEGIIADGMIPKLDNAFSALRAGVAEVQIKHAAHLLDPIGTTLFL